MTSFTSQAGLELAPTRANLPALAGVDAARLADAYAQCRAITRRAARNFYYGLRLTPEPRRSAVYSIYAWMRSADDQVDAPGPVEERARRLADLARTTDLALTGDPDIASRGPFWIAFAATMASFPIDPAYIREMLNGLGEDLGHRGYATREELEGYCYRVASTVGLTCIAIWGLREGADPALAKRLAIARGQAFQLTNILRDVGQDYDDLPRRVYIPTADLDRHGLTALDLRQWRDHARCNALVTEMAARAAEFYRQSASLESLIDPECAPALWGMTRIYRGLLEIIETEPARVVGPARIRLSSARKGLIALGALLRKRTGSWT